MNELCLKLVYRCSDRWNELSLWRRDVTWDDQIDERRAGKSSV